MMNNQDPSLYEADVSNRDGTPGIGVDANMENEQTDLETLNANMLEETDFDFDMYALLGNVQTDFKTCTTMNANMSEETKVDTVTEDTSDADMVMVNPGTLSPEPNKRKELASPPLEKIEAFEPDFNFKAYPYRPKTYDRKESVYVYSVLLETVYCSPLEQFPITFTWNKNAAKDIDLDLEVVAVVTEEDLNYNRVEGCSNHRQNRDEDWHGVMEAGASVKDSLYLTSSGEGPHRLLVPLGAGSQGSKTVPFLFRCLNTCATIKRNTALQFTLLDRKSGNICGRSLVKYVVNSRPKRKMLDDEEKAREEADEETEEESQSVAGPSSYVSTQNRHENPKPVTLKLLCPDEKTAQAVMDQYSILLKYALQNDNIPLKIIRRMKKCQQSLKNQRSSLFKRSKTSKNQ